MAVTLNGNLSVVFDATDTRTLVAGATKGIGSRKFAGSYAWQIASGIAAGQSDKIWGNTVTVLTAATDAYDLATGGNLVDEFGAAVVFAKLRAIVFSAIGIAGVVNTTTLQITRPTNGVPFLLTAADAVMPLAAGGILALADPNGGATVTAATGDLIHVINSAGASAGYEIFFVGPSA